jgi:carbonic anhydrase
MITGPLKEMLARNAEYAVTYKQPAPLIKMAAGMRASRAGVVVISCSDPRLNPYQILGIDAELRKFLPASEN